MARPAASLSFSKLLSSSAEQHAQRAFGPEHALPDFPLDLTKCLVVGTHSSRLVCVALQFAANAASAAVAAQGGPQAGGGARPGAPAGAPHAQEPPEVVLLGRKHALEEHMPVLAGGGMDTHLHALSHVKIRYLASHVELQQWCCCAHMLRPLPKAVVVHHLGSFFSPELEKRTRSMQLACTLACLVDAVEVLSKMAGAPVPLLVTEELPASAPASTGASPGAPLQHDNWHLLSRWLPLALEVTGSSSGAGTHVMSVHTHSPAFGALPAALQQASLHYRVSGALQVLYAEQRQLPTAHSLLRTFQQHEPQWPAG